MRFLLLVLVLILTIQPSFSQWIEQDQITIFSSIFESPIKMEVQENDGKFIFYAINSSTYPFEININFTELSNLQASSTNRTVVLFPGRSHVVSLSQKDMEIATNYSYSISYTMGDVSKLPYKDYPYLLPIGEGNTTKLYSRDNNYMIDFFKLEEGDTIYCMRKGYVTALPEMFHSSDRLAKSNSLEIMHADGTVMIYENLNENKVFTELSEKVVPGQAIGVIGEKEHLIVQLYQLSGGNFLKRLEIEYFNNGKNIPFCQELTNIKAEYPLEIISREMNKRELKRYMKTLSEDFNILH